MLKFYNVTGPVSWPPDALLEHVADRRVCLVGPLMRIEFNGREVHAYSVVIGGDRPDHMVLTETQSHDERADDHRLHLYANAVGKFEVCELYDDEMHFALAVEKAFPSDAGARYVAAQVAFDTCMKED